MMATMLLGLSMGAGLAGCGGGSGGGGGKTVPAVKTDEVLNPMPGKVPGVGTPNKTAGQPPPAKQ